MRISLPGDAWAEIREASTLTGADQDEYQDMVDAALRLRQAEADAAAAALPPANPAVMPDPADTADRPRARLSNADVRGLRDKILSSMITAWSFDAIPLPYTSASRASLPIYVCNALQEAISPHIDALNGGGPKENLTSPTSATTSAGTAPAPQPAPPAVSSATPGG
jgi:hypothetical protein